VGSLATSKAIPKDADVLVTINGTMDLGELARAGRRLKGSAQTINSAPTSFSPMQLDATSVASAIIASAIHAWHVSPSSAGAASTPMTTFTSSRRRKNCLPRRQSIFGQMLSADARCRLM
jgi:ABC-type branched-subunit amino acid transport system substrate-binding protein